MKKVFFLDSVHKTLQNRLEEKGFQCIDMTHSSKEEILDRLPEAEGIVMRSRFPMNEEMLSRAVNLEFIARSGAGMENIDESYCQERNIQLFNAPEGNRNAVGEHALGMLLSLFNKLHTGDSEVRKGIWDREGNRGVELDGRTVGIIGYGNNGSAFARKLRGFDVRVLACDKYKSGFGDDFVEEAGLELLMKESNVLSLHIPQNEETMWMVNRDFIRSFSHPFYLVNLSRGKIVRTDHLLEALDNGQILGACLDVLEFEKASFENMFDETEMPEPFAQLLGSDKVILSPHVGGWTVESYRKLSEVLADKVLQHYMLA